MKNKIETDSARTGLVTEEIRKDLIDNLFHVQGRFLEVATVNDWYLAAAYTVRARLLRFWVKSAHNYYQNKTRTVCYLSAEFLMGPQLGMNLLRLGIQNEFREAVSELGMDLDNLLQHEGEPGLGSGGLGRLAACFTDSLATLGVPCIGYGIRYEFGIFTQEIRNGWQTEVADRWLRMGNPWEIARPEIQFDIKFGGRTESYQDHEGRCRVRWIASQVVKGTPYDTFVLGFGTPSANFLRLWKAEATESFDFQAFNKGDYYGAVHDKVNSENITKVLYPNDEPSQGRELRLKQQYFFVSCSLQDMIRLLLQTDRTPASFDKKYAVQLNDTHPSLAIPELMRLLVDEHLFDWEAAWSICQRTFGYTNHTLLPEALERWPVDLFARLLPRHLEIVYEINRRFLEGVRQSYPGDEARIRRVSLIDETGGRYVRMAHLASVGSHAINGVAQLHTRLLEEQVLSDFYEMMPEKFSSKTNGITPRRFLLLSNPGLARLITDTIGDQWVKNLEHLRKLETLSADSAFQAAWQQVKKNNKILLAAKTRETTGVLIDPASLFDVQAKRIHEYKRQHLNLLYVVTLYNRIKQNPEIDLTPRTFIFAGKAAPDYYMAKLIIKLANSIAETIDLDPDVRGRLRVVFLPDLNVQNAQYIYPAAELSEQISTAGKEASGTGNMKMALNGALTIGTLDGANIEIREEVGAENFFVFGMNSTQVSDLWRQGYHPRNAYESTPELRAALDLIASGAFSRDDPGRFRPLVASLLDRDAFMALADYKSYVDCQDEVSRVYLNPERWTQMSILNVARMGKFSSDRAVREYCEDIWKVPVPAV